MSKKDLLVSIITPTYNSEKYLEETIMSVTKQSYPNIEYIIIDGGSKDATPDIIRKYKKNIAYWISEPDNGQTDAINKGFLKSKGDMVGWLGSDDMLYPDTIEKIVNFIEKNNINLEEVGVIFGDVVALHDGKREVLMKGNKINRRRLLNIWPQVLQPGSLHPRWVIEKIGLPDVSLNYCMDYEYWLRILEKSKSIYIDATLAKFRMHTESKSVSQKYKFAFEILKTNFRYNKNPFAPVKFVLAKRIIAERIKSLIY
jgi:glycosyltransferase involved in cell wall biosynthesis